MPQAAPRGPGAGGRPLIATSDGPIRPAPVAGSLPPPVPDVTRARGSEAPPEPAPPARAHRDR
ncbi:hypothetical protein FAGKG844_120111 [Frankia sp. AgKG'84/4]